MSQSALESFGAFRKANELFDFVVEDMEVLQQKPQCWRLIGQQVGSADSICSNIEEGYGRGSQRDYTHFLVMARGSARETRGRYTRMKHWLAADLIAARVALCDEIIGILSSTIETLQKRAKS